MHYQNMEAETQNENNRFQKSRKNKKDITEFWSQI